MNIAGTHQDHDYRVSFEEKVQVRLARYAVVCPEIRIPIPNTIIAGEGLERQGGRRGEYLQ